ncbi:GerAB/ArcD/ProY family transporter [Paenibacillus sp. NPDC056579]|uniref:GerAB/ArcD/ProY family transporter n=1 Tax=unclassified Paenibacillus TaxID=185978 RepID=UPI001EF856FD|nr:GerAB/ArcD/ProY family transporter [Paenibacillus sp. H1-7]ULL17735.1 hypothetical protein DVH26_26715 [Paenibacillus sp. H1-7]
MNIKDKITNGQMGFLLFSIMVGVGILSLPQAIATKSGVDGWMSIIIGGIAAAAITIVMAKLGVRFPDKGLTEYGPILLGRIGGTFLCIIFIVYFLCFVSIVVRVYADVTKLFLLDKTPIEVIIMVSFLVSTYIVQLGINPIARFNQLVQPVAVILLFMVLILTFGEVDLGENLPILGDGFMPVLRSIPTTFFSFLGFEMILFLLPLMDDQRSVTTSIIRVFSFVTALYVIIVVVCVGILGAKEVSYVNYPTLAIAKNIILPGSFVERLESVMMLAWIPFALTTIVLYHYCASLITSKLLKLEEHRVISLLYMPIVFLAALLPKNVLQVDTWSNTVGMGGMIINCTSPLLLWGAYIWKKRRGSL